MTAGIQFIASMNGGDQFSWFTWGWPQNAAVDWSLHCLNGFIDGQTKATFSIDPPIAVENSDSSGGTLTYWITIKNSGQIPAGVAAVFNATSF
jgi:hypothetical protein